MKTKKTSKAELVKRIHAIAKLCILEEETEADFGTIKKHVRDEILAERMRCYILVRKWGDAGTESLQTLLAKIEGFKS